MFFTWDRGAALHVVPGSQTMAPLGYLQEQAITVLFSVPSMVGMLNRMKLLQPGVLPELRLSIFSGEPLPVALAELWSAAAPGSVVENFYGPTEAAVSCSHQRFETGRRDTPSARGFVSIGLPFARHAAGNPRPASGARCRPGWPESWRSPAPSSRSATTATQADRRKFLTLDGERWYLTGDQAMS